MTLLSIDHPAAWRSEDLARDHSWIFMIGDACARQMRDTVLSRYEPDRDLLDYRAEEFDLGDGWSDIEAALKEVKYGRGVALIKGLPRAGLDSKQFELLSWAIGLRAGVARPQGKATQYISAVKNAGMTYRTGTGRGYSSNAELDFHTDSSDLVFLSCYNKALSGGKTILCSSLSGHQDMANDYADQLDWLYQPIGFSRQGEAAPDEGPFVVMPVFSEKNGNWFGRWNWNRVRSAQQIEGAPFLSAEHIAALEQFDQVVRRPDIAYEMWLEPGDLQILSSHVTLHSRTEFVDHDDEAKRRLLYRLWIAPPDNQDMPEFWRDLYRSCEGNTVRGGIRGHQYAAVHAAYEQRQAGSMGMQLGV